MTISCPDFSSAATKKSAFSFGCCHAADSLRQQGRRILGVLVDPKHFRPAVRQDRHSPAPENSMPKLVLPPPPSPVRQKADPGVENSSLKSAGPGDSILNLLSLSGSGKYPPVTGPSSCRFHLVGVHPGTERIGRKSRPQLLPVGSTPRCQYPASRYKPREKSQDKQQLDEGFSFGRASPRLSMARNFPAMINSQSGASQYMASRSGNSRGSCGNVEAATDLPCRESQNRKCFRLRSRDSRR